MCEQPASLAQQRAPSVGEFHPTAGSIEQCHAKLLLKSTDLVTQRRLGDVQPLGGPAEVKLLSDSDEVLHKAKVEAFDRRNLTIIAGSAQPVSAFSIRARPIVAVYWRPASLSWTSFRSRRILDAECAHRPRAATD